MIREPTRPEASLDLHVEPRALSGGLAESLEGGDEPEVVERGRAQLDGPAERDLDLLQLLPAPGVLPRELPVGEVHEAQDAEHAQTRSTLQTLSLANKSAQ